MTQRPEIIEDDINRIRDRMEARMESLHADLDPSRLVSGIFTADSESAKSALSQVATQARENPLAATLIGAGIAAMFFSRSGSTSQAHAKDRGLGSPEQRIGSGISSLSEQVSDAQEEAAVKVSVAKAKVKGKAQAAKEMLHDASETMSETADNLLEKATTSFDTAKETARRVPTHARARAEGATEWVKENPIPAGLMALAAGAAISSFFTSRSTTSRLDASKQLHEEARQHASEPDVVGSVRFNEREKAAKPSSTRKTSTKRSATVKKTIASKNKAIRKTAAKSSLKPKPIPTKTAKARTLAGRPETGPRAGAKLNGSAQYG